MLLRETDLRLGLLDRLAAVFSNPNSVEHGVRALVAQRVYALALGYEDLNDHDELRGDSLLVVLVGWADSVGRSRWRERDRGYPLAGSSTLNRLEWDTAKVATSDRNTRIAADAEAMERLAGVCDCGSPLRGRPGRLLAGPRHRHLMTLDV